MHISAFVSLLFYHSSFVPRVGPGMQLPSPLPIHFPHLLFYPFPFPFLALSIFLLFHLFPFYQNTVFPRIEAPGLY